MAPCPCPQGPCQVHLCQDRVCGTAATHRQRLGPCRGFLCCTKNYKVRPRRCWRLEWMVGRVGRRMSSLFLFLSILSIIIQDKADLLNVPIIHLPHLLRIIGPSFLTLFKHVLGRQRILIYTLPPVEVACILCQAAADMCYQVQATPDPNTIKARNRDPICVLGMVTLSDLDRLHSESKSTRGWIACTTDALFLEKPSYYDLLIDLTTSTPHRATRPTFYTSKPVSSSSSPSSSPRHTKTSTHRLSTIRFTWSDIKLVSSLFITFKTSRS